MKKVRCIRQDNTCLKHGQVYTIWHEDDSFYYLSDLKDPTGKPITGGWIRERFEVVQEDQSTDTSTAKKYVGECPCGIAPEQCEYHRSPL